MQQALVIGRATATIKDGTLHGRKLLLVQPRRSGGRQPDGPPLLVVDGLGAGIGETVLITNDGRHARQWLGSAQSPVSWTTVGIEDA